MVIEWTMTIGSLLQTFVISLGVIGAFYAMKQDISLLKNDIKHLNEGQKALTEAFTQLGKILTQVAVQDNRINMIEKRMDEMAHGQGFVRAKK